MIYLSQGWEGQTPTPLWILWMAMPVELWSYPVAYSWGVHVSSCLSWRHVIVISVVIIVEVLPLAQLRSYFSFPWVLLRGNSKANLLVDTTPSCFNALNPEYAILSEFFMMFLKANTTIVQLIGEINKLKNTIPDEKRKNEKYRNKIWKQFKEWKYSNREI